MRKGGMGRDEVDRLGDMLSVFKRKRELMSGWEEIETEYGG